MRAARAFAAAAVAAAIAFFADAAPQFISVKGPVPRKGPTTAVFVKKFKNRGEIVSAEWTLTSLGVFRAFANGREVGADDFLKPGYTHLQKRRSSFSYDIAPLLNRSAGAENVLSAEVSCGWWRDEIVCRVGKRSAFRGSLEITYADGTKEALATDESWKAAYAGPVRNAEIWGGERYDARIPVPWRENGADSWGNAEVNREFNGAITPLEGRSVKLRRDLELGVVSAWVWKGAEGATKNRYGRAKILRRYSAGEKIVLRKGEKLVVDFGQNCAGVPEFSAAASSGTVLHGKPAEMLNDSNGEKSRGNAGPAKSAYLANYRVPRFNMHYFFAGTGEETYHPSYTYYGGRYWSFSATDTVVFSRISFIPAMSIAKEDETGTLETGHDGLNRLISNCVWGMRSNYLSVPTDCPQRNERWGWSGDTQVFAGAAVYAADVYGFLSKWMTDMRDSQMGPSDRFPGSFRVVAPDRGGGMRGHNIGWSDAGVIVPWTLWKNYGDTSVIDVNWKAMNLFMDLIRRTKYVSAPDQRQTGDWLSLEKYEGWRRGWGSKFCENPFWPGETEDDMKRYWNFLGACHRISDLRMMRDMALATGRAGEAAAFEAEEKEAVEEFRENHLAADGRLPEIYNGMQTPSLFVLRLGLLPTPAAWKATADELKALLEKRSFALSTGFLGTPILLDTLCDELDSPQIAYSVLLQRDAPGWLYSIDQGATTIWERWNGYTKEKGFGPVAMNSFNHYAAGAVMGWMYRTMAGIRPGAKGGYKEFVLRPRPDRRIGWCKASFRTKYGEVKSEWRYAQDALEWKFTVPPGTQAEVFAPDGSAPKKYGPGDYTVSFDSAAAGGRGK